MDNPFEKFFQGYRWRVRHYRAVFGQRNPSTEAVVADLTKFCSFLDTTREPGADEKEGWILEGRRQVFLRIVQHTQLSAEELFALYHHLDAETRTALFDNSRAMPVYKEN
jgi:hypothetical protein